MLVVEICVFCGFPFLVFSFLFLSFHFQQCSLHMNFITSFLPPFLPPSLPPSIPSSLHPFLRQSPPLPSLPSSLPPFVPPERGGEAACVSEEGEPAEEDERETIPKRTHRRIPGARQRGGSSHLSPFTPSYSSPFTS